MAPKTGITWDAEADQKILVYVLSEKSITIDWKDLAAHLSSDAGTCTVGALQKHVSRLRTKGKDAGGSNGGSSTPAGKPSVTSVDPVTPTPKGQGKAKVKKRPVQDSYSDEARGLRRKKVAVDPPLSDETPSRVKLESADDVI